MIVILFSLRILGAYSLPLHASRLYLALSDRSSVDQWTYTSREIVEILTDFVAKRATAGV